MILLQYRTSKYGRNEVKVFINKAFAEEWAVYNKDDLVWVSYSDFTNILTTAGEIVVEFSESHRVY